MDFETRAIHEGQEPDPATGAVTVPIYQTSTYVQEAVGEHKGYDYSRTANPTRRALELCLASLESADHGEVYVGGAATSGLSDVERTQIRRTDIGFVYQSHRLLPEFSALENVMLPQMIRGLKRGETVKRASEILSYLGLGERIKHRPAELSGGEQQRVAIARAVANAPRALLADEPTGNLDPHTADHVFGALMQLVKATRVAMLIATHNMELASRMDRRVSLVDGQVVELD